jgi:hypothetical protein
MNSGKRPMALPLVLSADRFRSHSKDENQNGAVDFVDSNGKALISHPIGSNGGLPIHIGPKTIDDVHDALVRFS